MVSCSTHWDPKSNSKLNTPVTDIVYLYYLNILVTLHSSQINADFKTQFSVYRASTGFFWCVVVVCFFGF